MTPQEKKAQRALRHQIERQGKRLIVRRMGLYSTGPQIKAALRQFVDGYLSRLKHMSQAASVQPLPHA